MAFILALDEGTTSARAIIVSDDGSILASAQKEITQIYPQPGWVEHDPEEIWSVQIGAAIEALGRANLSPKDLTAIGITNQRETVVVWDRTTGVPICNAIVWQDRRTAEACAWLRNEGLEPTVASRTGLRIDPYFSATKIAWILDNVSGARLRAESGELVFGTIDTWLVWKLTGGRLHLVDASNASRTLLFNIETGRWDPELLRIFRIPPSMLPQVTDSCGVIAHAATELLRHEPIPISGIAGDQQAALFGQLCIAPGQAKTTYGTGCFMLQQLGETIQPSRNRLLTTISTRIRGVDTYAFEGSVFIGGALVQWLRDGLGFFENSGDVTALAASVPDSDGVVVVPAFVGLGAPHWDPDARGLVIGLTRGTTRAHLARASLEAIAFQVADLLLAMRSDSGLALDAMRVDGGASANDLLMQFQADVLGIPVVRPKLIETTALGAAYLAGLGVGVWDSMDALVARRHIDRVFEPSISRDHAEALMTNWHRAVNRAKGWAS